LLLLLLLLLLLSPGELYQPPQSWAKAMYNVQQWSRMPQVRERASQSHQM
jgi:hypothetical protein